MNVFPERITEDRGDARIQGGLTLRDYFASQALIGLLVSSRGFHSTKGVTEEAYEIADMMTEARDR